MWSSGYIHYVPALIVDPKSQHCQHLSLLLPRILHRLKLSTLSNITNPKTFSAPLYALPVTSVLQLLRWCHDFFLSQYPGTPMHAQRPITFRIHENVDGIFGTSVYVAEHPTRLVGADGNQTEVKGAAMLTNLRKGRASGKMRVGSRVIVFSGWNAGGNRAVACVTVGNVSVGYILGKKNSQSRRTQQSRPWHHQIPHSSLPKAF